MRPRFATLATVLLVTLSATVAGCDSAEEDVPDAFFVAFVAEVTLDQTGSQLACSGTPEYRVGHPTYIATFPENRIATRYTGRIQRSDGTFGAESELTTLSSGGGGMLTYTLGVGPIVIFSTCSASAATAERQRRMQYLASVGHQGIEVIAHAR